jgi:hypothetical protein
MFQEYSEKILEWQLVSGLSKYMGIITNFLSLSLQSD